MVGDLGKPKAKCAKVGRKKMVSGISEKAMEDAARASHFIAW